MANHTDLSDLIQQAVRGSYQARLQAIEALSKLGETPTESLIALLHDPQQRPNWWFIVQTLGKKGDRNAVEPLINLLEDLPVGELDITKRYIIGALGELRDPRAVDVAIKALHTRWHEEEDGEIYDEPDHDAIEAAAWALYQIGDPRGAEAIVRRLLEGDHWHDHAFENWSDEWRSIAFDVLINALKNEDAEVRRNAAGRLGELGDKRGVEPLIKSLLEDTDKDVRHAAAYGLSEMPDPRAFDALVAALNDEYEQTRAYAAMALGTLKDRRAETYLNQALKDDHPLVSKMAHWALDWIEGRMNLNW